MTTPQPTVAEVRQWLMNFIDAGTDALEDINGELRTVRNPSRYLRLKAMQHRSEGAQSAYRQLLVRLGGPIDGTAETEGRE